MFEAFKIKFYRNFVLFIMHLFNMIDIYLNRKYGVSIQNITWKLDQRYKLP